jgi:hypothetical protein
MYKIAVARGYSFIFAKRHLLYRIVRGKVRKDCATLNMRLVTILILFSFTANGQTEGKRLQTSKYSGTFSYSKGKSGPSGSILIYPESDSTVLFYIDINTGAPSYNMGSLYGRLKMSKGQGSFVSVDHTCQWQIQVSDDKLTIRTINEFNACGFGNGVIIDGVFGRTSRKTPDHFINQEGTKYFFKTTTPEKYYSE